MVTWIHALSKTRNQIRGTLSRIFTRGPEIKDVPLEELEETLLRADLPVRLVDELVHTLEKSYGGLRVSKKEMLKKMLVDALGEQQAFSWDAERKPLTVLIVGVNGSGKTTTCAKLARLVQKDKLKPLLGATDTFRAAGADQLKWWAGHIDSEVVAGAQGSDAAAVAYDALNAAIARKMDVLLIDTAGRMHTKQPLMQELQKVRGSLSKQMPGAPDEIWMVLDATLGQNAIHQARQFHESVALTGVIVSKLDGSSKAGFIFGIRKELNIPIRFIGLGEGPDDLSPFDPQAFTEALLAEDSPAREGG
ncbi:MAG: signal recognition particle-docking protein FtsY [Lentisphaerota bacterium]